jgi:uncharacterized membrane protein YfcA
MDPASVAGLAALIFLAALLYSSVGHAGASGYLAAMALFGLAPAYMKPTALALNILVASIATFKYYRAGFFSGRLYFPLVIASAPLAFTGGWITLPGYVYKPIVGVLLVFAAAWSFVDARRAEGRVIRDAPIAALVAIGAVVGLLSGLTGVGGGIFVSPLLLVFRWAQIRVISGVAAPFILVNSIAGLAGVAASSAVIPSEIPLWALAALLGGLIGSHYGSRRLRAPVIQRLLSIVLLIAGVKMMAA